MQAALVASLLAAASLPPLPSLLHSASPCDASFRCGFAVKGHASKLSCPSAAQLDGPIGPAVSSLQGFAPPDDWLRLPVVVIYVEGICSVRVMSHFDTLSRPSSLRSLVPFTSLLRRLACSLGPDWRCLHEPNAACAAQLRRFVS